MEDLYTGNVEEVVRYPGLTSRGTHLTGAAHKNLPNLVADMHKMKVDSDRLIASSKEYENKQQIEKLNGELERMSEQLYQVMKMNTNWQRYNDQREAKDQEKQQERNLMIHQIKMLKEHITMTEQKIMEMKLTYKNDGEVRAENVELRKQLEMKEAEIQKLKLEIQNSQSEDSKTMIEFLRQQVNVYVEDFRKERLDREAIQAKFDTTRQELLEARRMIEELKNLNRREDASYRYGNWERSLGIRNRGIEYQKQPTDRYNASGLSDEVEIDGDEIDSMLSLKKDEALQCPTCSKRFACQDHYLLVKHMDICS